MASNYFHLNTPVEDECANYGGVGDNYYQSLNDLGYKSDTTKYAKHATNWLNGIWANRAASFCSKYKVSGNPSNFAAKGCAPVPKRAANSSNSNIGTWNKTSSFTLSYTSGKGIHIGDQVLTKSTHCIIDLQGAGGGGGGGHQDNLNEDSCGGGGGGAGAFVSVLCDMSVLGSLTVSIGTGGSGGKSDWSGLFNSNESTAGSNGSSSSISHNNVTCVTAGGGYGGERGGWWDGGDYRGGTAAVCQGSAGGAGGSYTPGTIPSGMYLLDSKTGANGGRGGINIGDSGIDSGDAGGGVSGSIAFGDLFSVTTTSYSGGASTASALNSGSGAIGGGGGASYFNNGGYGGGSTALSAQNGTNGSGGGGTFAQYQSSRSGGSGGNGYCRIHYEVY